jgi:hypothetical protein
MRSITFKVTLLIFLCLVFFSRGAFSTTVALPDTLQPNNISYSYFIKHWESELLVGFSASEISVAPVISIDGEPLKLQEIFKGLNISRLYANNVYVSVESTRDFKDYNSVHVFIEVDEAKDPSGSRRDKSNVPLKYLFVRIYKNGTFEAKLVEDK